MNLIRKTAFEQTRRRIDFAASVDTEDEEGFTLARTPGVGDTKMRKWRPNWRLSVTDPLIKDKLEEAMMNYVRKGAYGRGENTNYFPSLHVTYTITENFLMRAAYAKTQAKVRFDRSTIPNTITEASPSDTNVVLGAIEGRNPDLKPVDRRQFRSAF